MDAWADAAHRQEQRVHGSQHTDRKEPVGGSHSDPEDHRMDAEREARKNQHNTEANKENQTERGGGGDVIVMRNEDGPLGIHVVPYYDADGRETGLYLQGIEPGGRVDRDGRMHVRDTVVEINGRPLRGISFQNAQRIFREALSDPALRLRVVSNMSPSLPRKISRKQPPPVAPKPPVTERDDVGGLTPSKLMEAGVVASPGRGSPPPKPARLHDRQDIMHPTNTRKIGRKIRIQLLKGQMGLGYSVTTRDNQAGSNAPIYIKNILPKGAAIEDGRLKPGDRLLEVNGIEMDGKSQQEAVQILRQTKLGAVVDLVVSRQEVFDTTLPRELVALDSVPAGTLSCRPAEKLGEDVLLTPGLQKEILTFEIAVNDTGSAGLGVSVKGKTTNTPNGPKDLGIFIKCVIHGGAAHKDGRLRTNDQLLCVNEQGLVGKTNDAAMSGLRHAMQGGPGDAAAAAASVAADSITVVIARRLPSTADSNKSMDSSDGNVEYLAITKVDNELYAEETTGDGSEDTNTTNTLSTVVPSRGPVGDGPPLPSMQRNPVIDRLTGTNKLYNDSYYRATHESMMEGTAQESTMMEGATDEPDGGRMVRSPVREARRGGVRSPPVIDVAQETMRIVADYDKQNAWQPPPSSRGRGAPTEVSSSSLPPDVSTRAPEPPAWLINWQEESIEMIGAGDQAFDREGFGRQSMSEKSGPSKIDAKSTDTYQRNKRLREERERERQRMREQLLALPAEPRRRSMTRAGSAESLLNTSIEKRLARGHPRPALRSYGPSLGMKKSSSLESLQAAVHDLARSEDVLDPGANYTRPQVKVVRGRGCNESFRAAVDRSYEAAIEAGVVLGPLSEEEQEAMRLRSDSVSGSLRSVPSVQAHAAERPHAVDDKRKKKKEKEKRKSLLRGLGSMFRVGRHKKDEEEAGNHAPNDVLADEAERQRQENLRLQERYRRLQERPADGAADSYPGRQQMSPANHAERMQQLRAEHQRRHADRANVYPGDAPPQHDARGRRDDDYTHRGAPAYRSERGMSRHVHRQGDGHAMDAAGRPVDTAATAAHRYRLNSDYGDLGPPRYQQHRASSKPAYAEYGGNKAEQRLTTYSGQPPPPDAAQTRPPPRGESDHSHYQQPRPYPTSPYSDTAQGSAATPAKDNRGATYDGRSRPAPAGGRAPPRESVGGAPPLVDIVGGAPPSRDSVGGAPPSFSSRDIIYDMRNGSIRKSQRGYGSYVQGGALSRDARAPPGVSSPPDGAAYGRQGGAPRNAGAPAGPNYGNHARSLPPGNHGGYPHTSGNRGSSMPPGNHGNHARGAFGDVDDTRRAYRGGRPQQQQQQPGEAEMETRRAGNRDNFLIPTQ